jgi:hypothetical protein
MSLLERLVNRKTAGIAALVAIAPPAADASLDAYNAFFHKDKPGIEYVVGVANAQEATQESQWKYAIMGAPMPTEETLIADGYVCINCDAPAKENRVLANSNILVTLKAYKNKTTNKGIILNILPNNEIYEFQEVNFMNKESKWAIDSINSKKITQILNSAGENFSVYLEKYGM